MARTPTADELSRPPEGRSVTCMTCEMCMDDCRCPRYICERCGGTGWDRRTGEPEFCWGCEGCGKLGPIRPPG